MKCVECKSELAIYGTLCVRCRNRAIRRVSCHNGRIPPFARTGNGWYDAPMAQSAVVLRISRDGMRSGTRTGDA